MKKLLFLLTSLCFALISNAQITITINNIVNVGDSLYQSIDTLPNNSSVSPQGTGNQTWDFSSVEAHDSDTIYLLHIEETPYYESFQNSNVCALILPDTIYQYITRNETGLSINGMVLDINNNGNMDTVIFERSESFIALPANYNDKTLDTTKAEIIFGNMKLIQTKFKTDTIDAYGELTIPLGTFSTLRFFTTNIQIDSIYTYSGGNWIFTSENIDTSYNFSWWTNDSAAKMELFNFEYDFTGDSIIDKITYLKDVRFSNIKEIIIENNNLIYPNPSAGFITFNGNVSEIKSIEIFDSNGRLVGKYIPKNNRFKIDISNKPAGLYFFKINSKKNYKTVKVILSK